MAYWLVKQEPKAYSWDDLVNDGHTDWDGVRNYQARNNLKEMQLGDLVLFYHSVDEKRVVGVARVTKEHYQDPTTDDERWVAVELAPVVPVLEPVTLADIKAEEKLANIYLVRQARLSVMPLEAKEFKLILKMGKTTLPA